LTGVSASKDVLEKAKPTESAVAIRLKLRAVALFISPTDVSNALVSRGQENDRDERKDEREGAGNAPLRKDNAKVL
jgi:hypothetical protein